MSEQKGGVATNAVTVPAKWQTREMADGSTELRVLPRGRGYWVVATLLLAGAGIGRAIVVWGVPHGNAGMWLAAALLLIVFALWCAYADEYWRMGSGYLEHHIDFGPLRRARRYQNAVLEIVVGRTSEGTPFYRLYAVIDGKKSFVLERGMEELVALARFIASRTAFRVV